MNLDKVYQFAKNTLENEETAHDWQHALRVEKNALMLAPSTLSPKDFEIIKASCWLHDTIDPKIKYTKQLQITEVETLLKEADADSHQINEIQYIIQNLSYSKNLTQKKKLSFLGQIVQDADRLDALGAIGIARAFYYGGSKNHALYTNNPPRKTADITEENYRQQNSVINHFYEKLLLLEDTMNTAKAQSIARERSKLMEIFLEQLFDEIK